MRYRLFALSPASGDQSVEAKHHALFDSWQRVIRSDTWQMSAIPKAPANYRGTTGASRSLSGFGDRSITGTITYRLRTEPASVTHGNDGLAISFDPSKDNYASLLDEVVPLIVETFSPMCLEVGDESFLDPAIQADGSIQVGAPRACGGTLFPVFYFSEDYVGSRFGMSMSLLASKLEPKADSVRLCSGGVYVIGSRQVLPFEEGLSLTREMEKALRRDSFISRWLKWISRRGE